MTAIAEARTRFLAEREGLEALADYVAGALETMTRAAGVPCSVKGRAKDVASFVGKIIRKQYDDPWTQITDKVGVRVTVDDPGDIDRVVQLVRDAYEVTEYQDKTRSLWEAEKIGYGGVHLQVVIRPDAEVVGGECEIQVRSAAQNLWSEMSHRLLYKPGVQPDDETKRALTRLAALMEIFDEEVMRRVNLITAAPGYQIEELINLVESQFYRFASATYDRSLSRYVLAEIGETFPPEDIHQYADTVRSFVDQNVRKLQGIYDRYAQLDAPVLIHQPESILFFERIAHDPYRFREVADRTLPSDELDQFESIWGL